MKFVFLVIFSTLFIPCSNAQYRKYKKEITIKSHSFQPGDRYNPSTAAVFAIVPGAGHIYVDQPFRGIIFPAGMLVSSWLIVSGSLKEWSAGWGNDSKNSGEMQMIAGLSGFFGFYIANFVDAVRVAKTKNLYYRENEFSLQLVPFIENQNQHPFGCSTAGLTLKMKF